VAVEADDEAEVVAIAVVDGLLVGALVLLVDKAVTTTVL
jgi:hypothetical protein